MSNEREYQVLSPISHGGEIVKDGTVTLPVNVAQRLLDMDQPPIADPNAEPAPAAPQGQKDPQPVTQAQIIEAIKQLDPENNLHYTKGNVPQVGAIETLVGGQITAAERDEAWRVFQQSQPVTAASTDTASAENATQPDAQQQPPVEISQATGAAEGAESQAQEPQPGDN